MHIRYFRDIHKDKRCFIAGNGPSLNNVNLKLLDKEITFGCNRIYLHKTFAPKYYVIEDSLQVTQFHNQINEYDKPEFKFIPYFYKSSIYGDKVIYIKFGRENNEYKFNNKKSSYFIWGGTVTYLMIQLAYWMGCNPIYLIGLDHNWDKSTNTNKVVKQIGKDNLHFREDYFTEGIKWALPNTSIVEEHYRIAKSFLEKEGIRILNATPGTKLEIFDKIDFNKII